ncbi:hypothetical protein EHS13_06520 [Paenibacillus psychroresistens]|uniref:2Fe-2S ferredoxin-type domain-containing protein n=1 Tax=Paenibacillus psychroresistens TaxID=1778678 RepID=A0A6B8RGB8_9BACL|nr:2Fe-2S iron-sulfur cluster-binding protein [Paenibacillus psychroresistens]QGQ94562.1 hypothetical protein EHS13_06520 [Paenibacillus psychroresistens]
MVDYRVTLLPSNQIFEVSPRELVLDAAVRQGIEIPYSCRNGTCRTCLFQVQEGTVIQEDAELCMLSQQEISMGRRLICMSTLKSDAILEKVSPRKIRP